MLLETHEFPKNHTPAGFSGTAPASARMMSGDGLVDAGLAKVKEFFSGKK